MRKIKLLIVLFLFAGVQMIMAQNVQLTGTVTSAEDGMGMPGVSVTVKGTVLGTMTDIDGKYVLSVPTGSTTVVFSFVGMKTVEVPFTGQSTINTTMEADVVGLDEVMVVAYGTTKKASFTGSAASVKSEDLEKMPVVSVNQAMAGLASGVQVTGSTGQPGTTPSIRIRGVGSINSSNEPLYVIDGVAQMSDNLSVNTDVSSLGSMSLLNPSDIESITILKDAAAAALYGSRAANGVVLITTKRGKSGETKFMVKSELGFSDFAVQTLELATPKEAFDYKVEGYKNYLIEYEKEAPDLAQKKAIKGMAGYFDQYDPSRPDSDYDWRKELFRIGHTRNVELSARGGDEKTKFFSSLGYKYAEGVAEGSDFERFSGRLNLDHKANDIVDLGFGSSVSRVKQNVVPSAGYYYANPMYSTQGFLNQLTPIRDKDGNFAKVEGGKKQNSVEEQALNFNENVVWNSLNQGYLKLNILEGLSFKSTNSIDFTQIYGIMYWSPISKDGRAYNGYANYKNKRRLKLATSNILTFNKSINEIHNMDFLVGYEAEDLKDRYINAEGKNFPNDMKTTLDVAAKPLDAKSGDDGDRMQSVLSRFSYNYDNKYYASLSYRTDASSRLGTNNRWGHFYSVSGSWRISSESFMQGVKFVNDWKLRASYGVNGTLPTSWVGAKGLYSFGHDYNGLPGSYYYQIENKDLKWEKNNNFSIATEAKLFEILSLEIEYYYRKTEDLLLKVPVSRTTGFDYYWDNVGSMINRGVEISLNSTNIKKENFMWTTKLTLAHNNNKIDKLDGQDNKGTFPFILRKGESYNSIYLRDWAGVDPANGHALWYVLEEEQRVDKDKDGKPDVTSDYRNASKKIVGKGDPLFIGSITNGFTYKNFDFSFMFTFKVGGDAYIGPHATVFDDGEDLNKPITKKQLENYWKKPGDNADLPKPVYNNPQHSNYNSSRRLVDATYARLKNVILGYNLPSKFVSRAKISNARIYASAANLLTFSKVDGFDPETTTRGVILNDFDFPTLKTVTFGIQFNF